MSFFGLLHRLGGWSLKKDRSLQTSKEKSLARARAHASVYSSCSPCLSFHILVPRPKLW